MNMFEKLNIFNLIKEPEQIVYDNFYFDLLNAFNYFINKNDQIHLSFNSNYYMENLFFSFNTKTNKLNANEFDTNDYNSLLYDYIINLDHTYDVNAFNEQDNLFLFTPDFKILNQVKLTIKNNKDSRKNKYYNIEIYLSMSDLKKIDMNNLGIEDGTFIRDTYDFLQNDLTIKIMNDNVDKQIDFINEFLIENDQRKISNEKLLNAYDIALNSITEYFSTTMKEYILKYNYYLENDVQNLAQKINNRGSIWSK